MSNTTDVVEQGYVTGGKVWAPPGTANASTRGWRERLCKITFIGAFIAFGLNFAVLIAHATMPSLDPALEHMPVSTFYGFSRLELADIIMLVLSVLIPVSLILAFRVFQEVALVVIISLALIGVSVHNISIRLHHETINTWGEQYGYYFSELSVPELFNDPNTVKAYNLETLQWEQVPIEIVDGNIVLVGVEKVSETEKLPELELVVENGSQYLVDATTGSTYEVAANDDGTLELRDEKKTDDE